MKIHHKHISPRPILLVYEEGHWYPVTGDAPNYYILPSDLNDVLVDLIRYCNDNNNEDIKEINKHLMNEFYQSFGVYNEVTPNNIHASKCTSSGYVYLLKCANKFK